MLVPIKMMLFSLLFLACNTNKTEQNMSDNLNDFQEQDEGLALATFGNGCFWCAEAVFQELNGVEKVVSGYAGGTVRNPSYKEVCTGDTGHAEVIRLQYNPEKISYTELLEVFFSTHNPTTLNRQGADVGTQYRSAIFYHNQEQKKAAEEIIALLTKEQVYDMPIVTEITPINNYYKAEDYHQNYYNNNKNAGYCRAVINPKLEKFRKKYKDKLKIVKAN
ncbi:MAG: peptide-methionine (S)-S-oxide reductase [Flavobacteriales bacterium]|nr:MAG: peptide-methionine (S)-S-oxide reductase [Flavobacteriales bacterium]